MEYIYKATRTSKTSKKWTVSITFTGKYNFEKSAWSGMKGRYDKKIVTAMSNVADLAEKAGVLNSYKVTVKTSKSVSL